MTVYARPDPTINLRDVPQYEITALEGKTVTGPDMVVGNNTRVSGKLIPLQNGLWLEGIDGPVGL